MEMKCDLGSLYRADGSCRYEYGNSIVLASVYGPCEMRSTKDELVDRCDIEVVFRSNSLAASSSSATATGPSSLSSYLSTSLDIYRAKIVHGVLCSCIPRSLFPRAAISVTIQVINDDGYILSTAINAAVMAVVDAGIPISFMPISAECTVIQQKISGSQQQEQQQKAGSESDRIVLVSSNDGVQIHPNESRTNIFATFSELNGKQKVSGLDMNGAFLNQDKIRNAIQFLEEEAKRIFQFIKATLTKRILASRIQLDDDIDG